MQDMLIVEGEGVTMTGSRILRAVLDVSISKYVMSSHLYHIV